ncbi:hypothetical protein [Paraburkholderia panacisoli]|uniref:hypothetical protein n=1 Tax=Paraburkholderia panacisoli TaxID=2603818 RepID=UPI001FEA43EE|nr:hypothetical protein [Paraburkholderia panacisoli]
MRSSSVTPPATLPPAQRRVALATAEPGRAIDNQPISQADKLRAEVSRYLRAARVNLQANNLSATKSRLAAAIAAQPDNRDALRMRSTVRTREQQRDALLSLAHGCGYVGHWTCMTRNASIALQIDSSSKEARRLATLSMHESAPPSAAPAIDAEPEPLPAIRGMIAHH